MDSITFVLIYSRFLSTTTSPPTTKAAYLVAHGTHDTIVTYKEDWINGVATPSCECKDLPRGQSSCFNDNNHINMNGPVLAAGIAQHRGYTGMLLW